MADVLSQSEIDALLSALSTGDIEPEQMQKEEEKHKVKLYDFRSPQKFSKDHIRTLELIHDNFARILSNYLTGQVRKNVKVKIETVEQITYEEFIHSIPNPTILTIFKMPPLNGTILFETNLDFSFHILDILLGGSGERKTESDEISDIDKNIMFRSINEMIQNLKLAWEDILTVEPEVESIETNPAINQTLAPNEPVALVSFSVEMGQSTTFINLCIPYLSIEKLLDKLVVQYWFKNEENVQEEARHKLEDGLNHVDVNVSVELGKTNLAVNDFLKLGVGDIIRLDSSSKDPVKVYVEDDEYYYGKPGKVGKKMGVEILDMIDRDVSEDE